MKTTSHYIKNQILISFVLSIVFSTAFAQQSNISTTQLMTQEQIWLLFGNTFLTSINNKNVDNKSTITNIEKSISGFRTTANWGTQAFFDKETTQTPLRLNPEQQKIWKTCNQYLNFSGVCSQNSLESDWRFPYSKIKSTKNIYNLYKDKSYDASSWESQSLKYHIALYIYLLPWNDRKKVYEEINDLKKNLATTLDFNGMYELIIPAGMVREDAPELRITFRIENNNEVSIETFLNKKKTNQTKTTGKIVDSEFLISFSTNGENEQYTIKKVKDNYKISGLSVEEINPFAKEMDLKKIF